MYNIYTMSAERRMVYVCWATLIHLFTNKLNKNK